MQQDNYLPVVPEPEWNRERAASRKSVLQLWKQHVCNIPSVFGRLAFLAGLKNPETGTYTHFYLSAQLGTVEADKVIRTSHIGVFFEWLVFNLQEQHADLNLFLASVEGHRRQILAACAVLAPHVWCIPNEAQEHERRLYLADLETILEPLYNQYGLTPQAPEKSAAVQPDLATPSLRVPWVSQQQLPF
jgi:hypothetical protein